MTTRIIDISDPSRVSVKPTNVRVLFESKEFEQEGFLVTRVELRHYLEKNDEELGPFSLITSYVETDKGSVEMVYDEGFRGDDSLNRTVTFLVANLGISGLILRSLITLREHLDGNSSHNTY
ncbi:MAG: hypothetical protein KC440_08985 [Nitrosarchaeum sp.]|nr:hypothetical protein [Nitrosarchaeum sp.]